MALTIRFSLIAGFAVLILAACGLALGAESKSRQAVTKPEAAPKPANAPAEKLAGDEQQVAEKYKRLEELLLRMAELNAGTDPRRAALLRKAVAQGKDRMIGVQFETLVQLIQKDQLSDAIEKQGNVDKDLQALLELLMSENRAKRLESEKARIREYLKKLDAIINQQKGIQGRTAGGSDPKGLSEEQAKVAGRTGDLAKEIKTNEEGGAKPGAKKDGQEGQEGENAKGRNADGQGGKKAEGSQGKKGDDQGKQEGKKTDGAGKKSEGSKGSEGKPSQGENKQGSPGSEDSQRKPGQGEGEGKASKSQGKPQGQQGQQGQNQGQQGEQQGENQEQPPQQDQDQNPARKRLEAARERMREAEQKLKEAQREGALDKQEKALQELQQAKADLEKILRQLREEEIERVLTMLEARFTKMLQMQRAVLEGTVKLDKVPQADRDSGHAIEAGRLSSKEAEIDLEADKAMTLLREDGSAVAFPEALEELRQDIRQVVQRLAEAKVDKITQGVEEEIIASLEEMIKALQKAIKDQEKRKQQQGNPPPGQPQDPPLVDVLAELKMIRSLQVRVNARTERYSKLVAGEQAENQDLIQALQQLGERQQKIYKITRDLSLGKNR